MRWKGRQKSQNIEDRRGQPNGGGSPFGRGGSGGGGFGSNIAGSLIQQLLSRGSMKSKIIGIVAIIVMMYVFKIDLSAMLGGGNMRATPSQQQSSPAGAQPSDEMAQFVSVVLADTEETWHKIFQANGQTYKEPRLVLFSGATRSACGQGQAAMGPFYCPADQKVYIDLSFYNDLKRRFKAPGDFAQAYVIAHEVGHHLQTLLGISGKVHAQRSRVSKAEGNKLSVLQELQADCFAGIWAHHAGRKELLEAGDIEEALTAAAAIGDDRIQKQSTGRISPESFTHGTSAQRQKWLKIGMREGKMSACDTFSASNP